MYIYGIYREFIEYDLISNYDAVWNEDTTKHIPIIYLQFDSTSSRVKVNQKPTLSFSDQTNCPEYNMSVTLSRQVRNF